MSNLNYSNNLNLSPSNSNNSSNLSNPQNNYNPEHSISDNNNNLLEDSISENSHTFNGKSNEQGVSNPYQIQTYVNNNNQNNSNNSLSTNVVANPNSVQSGQIVQITSKSFLEFVKYCNDLKQMQLDLENKYKNLESNIMNNNQINEDTKQQITVYKNSFAESNNKLVYLYNYAVNLENQIKDNTNTNNGAIVEINNLKTTTDKVKTEVENKIQNFQNFIINGCNNAFTNINDKIEEFQNTTKSDYDKYTKKINNNINEMENELTEKYNKSINRMKNTMNNLNNENDKNSLNIESLQKQINLIKNNFDDKLIELAGKLKKSNESTNNGIKNEIMHFFDIKIKEVYSYIDNKIASEIKFLNNTIDIEFKKVNDKHNKTENKIKLINEESIPQLESSIDEIKTNYRTIGDMSKKMEVLNNKINDISKQNLLNMANVKNEDLKDIIQTIQNNISNIQNDTNKKINEYMDKVDILKNNLNNIIKEQKESIENKFNDLNFEKKLNDLNETSNQKYNEIFKKINEINKNNENYNKINIELKNSQNDYANKLKEFTNKNNYNLNNISKDLNDTKEIIKNVKKSEIEWKKMTDNINVLIDNAIKEKIKNNYDGLNQEICKEDYNNNQHSNNRAHKEPKVIEDIEIAKYQSNKDNIIQKFNKIITKDKTKEFDENENEILEKVKFVFKKGYSEDTIIYEKEKAKEGMVLGDWIKRVIKNLLNNTNHRKINYKYFKFVYSLKWNNNQIQFIKIKGNNTKKLKYFFIQKVIVLFLLKN